ncbi:acetate/propionate family kinase [Dyadobacter sediminis]|uniref:Acetate kinase n=1 Tax=Dyadobacter sediminis TaxID=1493691 RepID=A0A5R9KEW5_9BACT|nr:acetate kinase [Dyadobacter sediminis]TLU94653.1 acetate kinase [Dyadobacter sediminis]GGB89319.1 acetate kinase [Dyadobacter sediminis]
MNILVINSGSSSLKYQLFSMPDERPLCTGLIEKIGKEDSLIRHKTIREEDVQVTEKTLAVKDFGEGMKHVLALLTDSGLIKNTDDLEVIGHRVVHGGEYFSTAVVIDPDVKQKILGLSTLAPLHNPVNYKCIEFAEKIFPNAKQIAVFDTAFHQTMPEFAFRYAIPEKYYSEMHIRAYGFHGTSHKYVSERAMEWLGKPDVKMISIHLGNGCSITAVSGGKSIDTSMGFGPLSGLVMGTRSGDIDPSVILHLQRKEGKTADEMDKLLNNESGLLGLAGSNDMRDVMKMLESGNYDAELAIDMYAYRIKKYIGSYTAVLNGLDAIVFTAGVGENDALMREKICRGMEYFGIQLDAESNRIKSDQIREISEKSAGVKVLVIPTNEELEIARQSFELLREDPPCEQVILY